MDEESRGYRSRYKDFHDGKNRPPFDERLGIEGRLRYAAPGTVLSFRPGTPEQIMGPVSAISYGTVFAKLVALGVLEEIDELPTVAFRKCTIDFRGTDGEKAEARDLDDIESDIDSELEDATNQLDVFTESGLREFVRFYLMRALRSSRYEYGMPGLEAWEDDPTPLLECIVTELSRLMEMWPPADFEDSGHIMYYAPLLNRLKNFWDTTKESTAGVTPLAALRSWTSGITRPLHARLIQA